MKKEKLPEVGRFWMEMELTRGGKVVLSWGAYCAIRSRAGGEEAVICRKRRGMEEGKSDEKGEMWGKERRKFAITG